jgi:hypothetical protein
LASGANKKATVYRFDREALSGFLDQAEAGAGDRLTLLTREGGIVEIPLDTVKTIAFVKEWPEPWPWQRKQFTVRPRQQGLWVRMVFLDGEEVEATMANQLTSWGANVFIVTPPDPSGGVQKVLVPRAALRNFEVLGVVGSPLKKKAVKVAAPGQMKMFE